MASPPPTMGLGLARPSPDPADLNPTITDTAPDLDVRGAVDEAAEVVNSEAERSPQIPSGTENAPLIDASRNPLQAVGAVLQNVSRGMRGQKLYTDELIERREANKMRNLKRLGVGVNALEKGMELAKSLPAGEQRNAMLKQYGEMFEDVLPGFTNTLNAAAARPAMTQAQLQALGEHRQELLALGGNTIEGALSLAQKPEIIKMLDRSSDRQNAPEIMQSFRRAREILSTTASGSEILRQAAEDGFTIDELADPAVMEQFGLNEGHLATIQRSPEIQEQLRPLGFIPTIDLSTRAKEQIKRDVKGPSVDLIDVKGADGTVTKRAVDNRGRTVFEIPTNIKASGEKPTKNDIITATAIKLGGGDLEGSGLPQGVIDMVSQMDTQGATRLASMLDSGRMEIRSTADGDLEILKGSAVTAINKQEAENKSIMDEQLISMGRLVTLGNRALEVLENTKNINTVGDTINRYARSFGADVKSVMGMINPTFNKNTQANMALPKDDEDHLTTLNATEAPDWIFPAEFAQKGAAFKTMMFNFAIAAASAVNGQTGRGLSDKDLAQQLRSLAVNASDPEQLKATIGETMTQAYNILKTNFQVRNAENFLDPESELPEFPTYEQLESRFTGKPLPDDEGAAPAPDSGSGVDPEITRMARQAIDTGNIDGVPADKATAVAEEARRLLEAEGGP